ERWVASSRFTRVSQRRWTTRFSIQTRPADSKSSFSARRASPPFGDRPQDHDGVEVDRKSKRDQRPRSETASYSNPGRRTAVFAPDFISTMVPEIESWIPSASKALPSLLLVGSR